MKCGRDTLAFAMAPSSSRGCAINGTSDSASCWVLLLGLLLVRRR